LLVPYLETSQRQHLLSLVSEYSAKSIQSA
jgi:hypothetical protein